MSRIIINAKSKNEHISYSALKVLSSLKEEDILKYWILKVIKEIVVSSNTFIKKEDVSSLLNYVTHHTKMIKEFIDEKIYLEIMKLMIEGNIGIKRQIGKIYAKLFEELNINQIEVIINDSILEIYMDFLNIQDTELRYIILNGIKILLNVFSENPFKDKLVSKLCKFRIDDKLEEIQNDENKLNSILALEILNILNCEFKQEISI